MFTSTNELKDYIKQAENDDVIKIPTRHQLIPRDWDLIPKVIRLLEPLNTATLVFEGDDASLSDVIPVVKRMKMQLNSINAVGVSILKNSLLKHTDNYLGGKDGRPHFVDIEKNSLYTYATLLDPRYKADYFCLKENAERAKRRLKDYCLEQQVDIAAAEVLEGTPPTSSGAPTGQVGWDDCLLEQDDQREVTAPLVEQELSLYFSQQRIEMKSNPLGFWKMHQGEFPIISKVALQYLCPPPSRAASEREFSVTGLIMSPKRNRLLPKNLEQLLFLKYNLRAVGYNTDLPLPPPEFNTLTTSDEVLMDIAGNANNDSTDEESSSSGSDAGSDED